MRPPRHSAAEADYRHIELLERRNLPGDAEAVLRHLQSPWPDVRSRAAETIGRLDEVVDADQWAKALEHEAEPDVRAEMVFASRLFSPQNALPIVRTASFDSAATVRASAAQVLGLQPASAESAAILLRLSRDRDGLVRRHAVVAFGAHADEQLLREAIEGEDDERVRWPLIYGLKLVGLESVLSQAMREFQNDVLREATGDPNFLVATFAEQALTARGVSPRDPVGAAKAVLFRDDRTSEFWSIAVARAERLEAAVASGQLGAAEVDALERILIDALEQRAVRERFVLRAAVAGLAGQVCRPSNIDRIFSTVSAWPEHEQAEFVRSVRRGSPCEAVVQRLLAADASPTVEAVAVRVGFVRIDVWQHAAPTLQVAALRAPFSLSSEVMTAALRSQHMAVRQAALERLAWGTATFGSDDVASDWDQDAVAACLSHTNPRHWTERLLALEILAPVRRDVLVRALSDASPAVARHALRLWPRLIAADEPVPVPGDFSARLGLAPPFSIPARNLSLRVSSPPRVVVTVEGRGEFVMELYPAEAPLHVGSFLALARSGYFLGRRVAAVGVAEGVLLRIPESGADPPGVDVPLAPEISRRTIPRGSLVAVTGFESRLLGPSARLDTSRAVRITLLPRPDLEGRVTCWGRVSMGMYVVDRLAPGDVISELTVVD